MFNLGLISAKYDIVGSQELMQIAELLPSTSSHFIMFAERQKRSSRGRGGMEMRKISAKTHHGRRARKYISKQTLGVLFSCVIVECVKLLDFGGRKNFL